MWVGKVKFLRDFMKQVYFVDILGEGTPIAVSSDENYHAAPLKLMQFHETYQNLRFDINHSKACMVQVTYIFHRN